MPADEVDALKQMYVQKHRRQKQVTTLIDRISLKLFFIRNLTCRQEFQLIISFSLYLLLIMSCILSLLIKNYVQPGIVF